MFDEIQKSMEFPDSIEGAFSEVEFVGSETAASLFPVSDIAQFSIGAAVSALQTLRRDVWGKEGQARVYRGLASLWCKTSAIPQGWQLPDEWDEFSNDYKVNDGWVRLHTNAEKHRAAALKVLGNPETIAHAHVAASRWNKYSLETEVIAAGGAAAELRGIADWARHPQGQAVQKEPIVFWE
ncbi:MAG: hypothetical protein ACR2OJ_17220, partial [Hyphomicrobiales bacterium]